MMFSFHFLKRKGGFRARESRIKKAGSILAFSLDFSDELYIFMLILLGTGFDLEVKVKM